MEIDCALKYIDSLGITRHFENQVEASGTYDKLYSSTKELIERKQELRIQRAELTKTL